MRCRLAVAALGAVLVVLVAATGTGAVAAEADPVARAAATCADHPDQASAQRAKDTRDADGDGIYCEDLPCPCLKPGEAGAGGGTGGGKRRTQRIKARVTSVADGDTIGVRAHGARRRSYSVRLIGFDTPETVAPGRPVQCGGPEATSRMLGLAFRRPRDTDGDGLKDRGGGRGRKVLLRTDPTQATFDRYGRLLAYVSRRGGGGDFGTRMLRSGWARVAVYGARFKRHGAYRKAERRARRADRGIWGAC